MNLTNFNDRWDLFACHYGRVGVSKRWLGRLWLGVWPLTRGPRGDVTHVTHVTASPSFTARFPISDKHWWLEIPSKEPDSLACDSALVSSSQSPLESCQIHLRYHGHQRESAKNSSPTFVQRITHLFPHRQPSLSKILLSKILLSSSQMREWIRQLAFITSISH